MTHLSDRSETVELSMKGDQFNLVVSRDRLPRSFPPTFTSSNLDGKEQ